MRKFFPYLGTFQREDFLHYSRISAICGRIISIIGQLSQVELNHDEQIRRSSSTDLQFSSNKKIQDFLLTENSRALSMLNSLQAVISSLFCISFNADVIT